MPSTYTTDFRWTLQANGENDGTWGDLVNTNYSLQEQAIAGVLSLSVAGSSNVTLTATNGASDQSRNSTYIFTGALTGNINTIRPAQNQQKIVYNNTSGAFTLTDIGASGTGVVIPQGYHRRTYFDGTNVVDSDPFGYDGPYATIASSSTTDLSTIPAANVAISGTTTITAFGTLPAGVRKRCRTTGALSITYNATSMLIRQGLASVTLDAGSTFTAISLGSGNWEVDNICFGGVAPFDRRAPGAIGGTTPSTGAFTSVTLTSTLTGVTTASMNGLTALYATGTPQTLTDASTVAFTATSGANAALTIGGNRTLGAPSGMSAGMGGSIVITQDGTGSRTLAYNAAWLFPGGTDPTLSTAAGAKDLLVWYSPDGTNAMANLLNGLA